MKKPILSKYSFLFSELIKRDFKKKYKSTYLGMLWSLASPLLTLFIMSLVFTRLFGSSTPHYTIYLFCGNICFSYFSDMTSGTMGALLSNSDIITKIRLPHELFVLSRAITSLINFSMTFLVFLLFCILDRIAFGAHLLFIPITILFLSLFSLGIGLLLSVMFVFFRDIQYLWSVFTMLLMYLSAIFYTTDSFPASVRWLFNLNPLYVYITQLRTAVIGGVLPDGVSALLGALYAGISLLAGVWVYKSLRKKFIMYL